MATYTGSRLTTTNFGRQDHDETATGSVAWTSALADTDTLVIPNVFRNKNLEIVDVEIFGTVPDSNATQTLGLSVGTEDDADAFLAATVIDQPGNQLFLKCPLANGTTIDGAENLVVTITADPATGVASGTLYAKVTAKARSK